MKLVLSRLQDDIRKLQTTIHKESADLIERVRKIDLKDNIDAGRKELEKVLGTKLKRFEPIYHTFLREIQKNAKKAGIDLGDLETRFKKSTGAAGKRLKSTRVKAGAKLKTVKKAVTKKKTTTKAKVAGTRKPSTRRKKAASSEA